MGAPAIAGADADACFHPHARRSWPGRRGVRTCAISAGDDGGGVWVVGPDKERMRRWEPPDRGREGNGQGMRVVECDGV